MPETNHFFASMWRLFVTLNAPETPLALIPARSLSACEATTPAWGAGFPIPSGSTVMSTKVDLSGCGD